MAAEPGLNPDQFTNLLLTQLPVYTDTILRDVRPTDGLAGHISSGQWDPFRGTRQVQDRFRNVKANVSKKWNAVGDYSTTCNIPDPGGQAVPVAPAGCTGGPCDPVENEICWGWERTQFGQEQQSWKSQLLCFDQIISATQAVEHIEQIVSEILRPATQDITSFYVRKKALDLAGNKILANSTMSNFTWSWTTTGDEEVFATPSAFPTSKLTPEMIQRQIPKMRNIGYFGKWTNDPFFGGYDQFAELLTDDDTCWELDKIAANSRISDQWRFQMWQAAHEYYKYGMGGQIGNYMTHVDPFCLRFNKKGAQAQLVLPFKNDPTTVGLGSDNNPDYELAQYQISFIWHRFAWRLETQKMEAVNPMMPFLVRGLNGDWRFAMDNLGADANGNPIANYRKNKGFFYADFRLAGRPQYTEWLTAIFHMREPKVIYEVAPCAADPGYPEQTYTSACDGCSTTFRWTPDADGDGHYVLAANSTTCNDEPQDNGAIDETTISNLAIALNADVALGAVGTWSADGTELVLTDATCMPVLPWVV